VFDEDRAALWATAFAVTVCVSGVALVSVLLR